MEINKDELSKPISFFHEKYKEEGKAYLKATFHDEKYGDRYKVSFELTNKGWSCYGFVNSRQSWQLKSKFFGFGACVGDVIACMGGFSSFQAFQQAG